MHRSLLLHLCNTSWFQNPLQLQILPLAHAFIISLQLLFYMVPRVIFEKHNGDHMLLSFQQFHGFALLLKKKKNSGSSLAV